MSPTESTGSTGGWQVFDVPRAYHDSFPAAQRPKLRPTWDVFGWSFIALTVVGLGLSAMMPLGYVVFPGPGVVAVATGYALVFTAVTWFLLSRLLIYRGTPWLLAGAAVLWGCTGAIALGAFTVSERLIDLAYDWDIGELAMSLGGAYPEEIAKALGVWLLLHVGRAWWNRPWHGLVAGVLVGIGFEAFENAGYAALFSVYHPTSDIAGVTDMWLLRLVGGPLLHALCTGLVGYGIGVAVYSAGMSRGRRLAWVLAGGAAGFTVHAGWNLLTNSLSTQIATMAVSWLLGVVLLTTAVVISTREARPLVAAGLYPSVSVYRRIPPAAPDVAPGPPPDFPPGYPRGYPGGYPPAFPPPQGSVPHPPGGWRPPPPQQYPPGYRSR